MAIYCNILFLTPLEIMFPVAKIKRWRFSDGQRPMIRLNVDSDSFLLPLVFRKNYASGEKIYYRADLVEEDSGEKIYYARIRTPVSSSTYYLSLTDKEFVCTSRDRASPFFLHQGSLSVGGKILFPEMEKGCSNKTSTTTYPVRPPPPLTTTNDNDDCVFPIWLWFVIGIIILLTIGLILALTAKYFHCEKQITQVTTAPGFQEIRQYPVVAQ
jgi:hypothetical protein